MMGKSQKIQDAAAKDQEFSNFLKQRQDELTPKVEAYRKQFESAVTDFYAKSGADQVVIAEGEKWDYHLTSEIGLGTLKTRVTEMVYSIFGISSGSGQSGKVEIDKTENGSVVMDVSDSVLSLIKIISSYKVMAAAAACSFIFQALNLFDTKLEISDSHNFSAQPLIPGLTLHLDVYNSIYSNERFLHSDQITTSYVRFKLIYSYKLAGTMTDLDCIQKLQSSISYQADKLHELQKDLTDAIFHMTPDTMEKVGLLQSSYGMMKSIYDENCQQLKNIINEHQQANTPAPANVALRSAHALLGEQNLEARRAQMLLEVMNA